MNSQSNQRGQWASNIGFILAAAGSAVGLGNIWSFLIWLGLTVEVPS